MQIKKAAREVKTVADRICRIQREMDQPLAVLTGMMAKSQPGTDIADALFQVVRNTHNHGILACAAEAAERLADSKLPRIADGRMFVSGDGAVQEVAI